MYRRKGYSKRRKSSYKKRRSSKRISSYRPTRGGIRL